MTIQTSSFSQSPYARNLGCQWHIYIYVYNTTAVSMAVTKMVNKSTDDCTPVCSVHTVVFWFTQTQPTGPMLSKEVWPCCLHTVHCEVMVLMCSKHNAFRKSCFIGKLKYRSSLRGLRITVCYGCLGSPSCQTGSIIQKIRDKFYLPFKSGRSQCQGARVQQNGSRSKGRSRGCSARNGRSRREMREKIYSSSVRL